jgi:hypothetical protein
MRVLKKIWYKVKSQAHLGKVDFELDEEGNGKSE